MAESANHLRHHTKKITLVILIAILVLAAGEYYLYRQQLHINKMVSEGLFQLKEQMNPTASPTAYLEK